MFAFLRVIFEVPVRRNGATPYGVLGNPIYDDGVDLLWPYSIDNSGRLVLTGVDSGVHVGSPYDPLADFDEMASRLGRRVPAAH